MIIGWDIGAANVKAAMWCKKAGGKEQVRIESQAFEIWRDKENLPRVLRTVGDSLNAGVGLQAAAVTMTAELSDAFLTKREGVLFILNCFRDAFPEVASHIFSLKGEFIPLADARLRPLDFAASNWMAVAMWVASQIPDCLIVDTGSTTTDILPIVDGRVAVTGRTDLERLAAGELVYTGGLRTNLAAISQAVPIAGRLCPVASEYFAISGDIHLILGNIGVDDYTCPTPDGQPVSIDSARRRVARLVCADTEMLDTGQIGEIARFLEERQIQQIQQGIEQVVSRFPELGRHPALIFGSGSFLAAAAAKNAGLKIGVVPGNPGQGELAVAPSLAVARLLAQYLGVESI